MQGFFSGSRRLSDLQLLGFSLLGTQVFQRAPSCGFILFSP